MQSYSIIVFWSDVAYRFFPKGEKRNTLIINTYSELTAEIVQSIFHF